MSTTRDCVVSALLILVAFGAWSACRAPAVDVRSVLGATGEPPEDVFAPTAGVATDTAGAEVLAHVTIDRSGPKCDVAGGLPSVIAQGRPIIGQPFRVTWTSRPTSPPDHPPALWVLAISNRDAVPAPIADAPGCWLHVHLDHLLTPGPGGLLTLEEGGRMTLDWSPGGNLMGVPFFCQAIMSHKGNAAGLVVSPVLRLVVGIE